MSGFPGVYKIRLTVDSMRREIVHALTARELELDHLIGEEIDRSLSSVDLRENIRREVDKAVDEVVRRTLLEAVSKVVYSAEVGDAIEATAKAAVAKFLASAARDR